MVAIAYDRLLSSVGSSLLVYFQILGHLVLNRCLQQLPGSFRQQLFQVALAFIFGSLCERNDFSFLFRCILSFGASSEYAVLLFFTERMRLFLSCHPQRSAITLAVKVKKAILMTNGPVEILLSLKLIENGVKTLLYHWGPREA
jgi:hypothetical protein